MPPGTSTCLLSSVDMGVWMQTATRGDEKGSPQQLVSVRRCGPEMSSSELTKQITPSTSLERKQWGKSSGSLGKCLM